MLLNLARAFTVYTNWAEVGYLARTRKELGEDVQIQHCLFSYQLTN